MISFNGRHGQPISGLDLLEEFGKFVCRYIGLITRIFFYLIFSFDPPENKIALECMCLEMKPTQPFFSKLFFLCNFGPLVDKLFT